MHARRFLLAACYAVVILFAAPADPIHAACVTRPAYDPHIYPSQCIGDVAYGEGDASTWGGPGVARNDCTYPWTDCTPIRITNLDDRTAGYGRSIVVTPTMYCDCWRGLAPGETGPNGERPRLVDLDPAAWMALGIPYEGIWRVRVEPLREQATERSSLPDTAVSR